MATPKVRLGVVTPVEPDPQAEPDAVVAVAVGPPGVLVMVIVGVLVGLPVFVGVDVGLPAVGVGLTVKVLVGVLVNVLVGQTIVAVTELEVALTTPSDMVALLTNVAHQLFG
jgi:hypothetical protein